jgi:hypothetical protein
MSKYLDGPTIRVNEPYIYDISQGGTGETNIANVISAFGMIPVEELGNQNGVLGLDKDGFISKSIIINSCLSGDSISGNLTLATNVTGTYTITDFDSRKSYQVYCTNGSVTLIDDTITYVAPASAGIGGFTINTTFFPITITGSGVGQPAIISPPSSNGIIKAKVIFVCSAFSSTSPTDAHLSTTWQLSRRSDFSVIDKELAGATGNNLLSWTILDLLESSVYYARVRHNGSISGNSIWSQTLTFSTRISFWPRIETAAINSPDGRTGDNFGYGNCISKDGSLIVIGANTDSNSAGINCGSIYIFSKNQAGQWTLLQQFYPTDPTYSKLFGSSISISADNSTIAIGAPGDNDYGANAGAVYVYIKSGTSYVYQAKIKTANVTQNSWFGYSIALTADGNALMIGAYGWYNTSKGAVYHYKRDTSGIWVYIQGINVANAPDNAWFGLTLDLSSDGLTMIVGAPGVNTAYFYTRTSITANWAAFTTSIVGPPGVGYARIVKLSGDGNYALITAYSSLNSRAVSTGAAFLYQKTGATWPQVAKLLPSDGAQGDLFGQQAVINSDGKIIVVGAIYNSGRASRAGAAYVFIKTGATWPEQSKLLGANTALDGDNFSRLMSMDSTGQLLLVASQNTIGNSSNVGGVHVFE